VDLDLFDPRIVLSVAKVTFGVKNVEAPSKNFEKSPIMCFVSMQKVASQTVRISGAFFLCTGATMWAIWPNKFSLVIVYRS
jgi:hypothetical protein